MATYTAGEWQWSYAPRVSVRARVRVYVLHLHCELAAVQVFKPNISGPPGAATRLYFILRRFPPLNLTWDLLYWSLLEYGVQENSYH